MTADDLIRWLEDPRLDQPAAIATLRERHVDTIREMFDDDRQRVVREIRKRLGSKKLAGDLFALISAIDRNRAPKPRTRVGKQTASDRVVPAPVARSNAKAAVQVSVVEPKTAPQLDDDELERHLATLPPGVDDPGYLVFADWLQSKGHPWGELVVLHHAAQTATGAQRAKLVLEVESLLGEYGHALVGELARDSGRFIWHLGFIRTAIVGSAADASAIVAAVKALVARPIARMVDGIVLQPLIEKLATTRDWTSWRENIVDPWGNLGELAAVIPDRVVHLGFGGWPARASTAYLRMPSFGEVSRRFTRLHRLEVTGSCTSEIEPLELPHLLDLELRFAAATPAVLDTISRSRLPNLERLAVWLGGTTRCNLDDVYPPGDDSPRDSYPPSFTPDDLENLDIHGVASEVDAPSLRRFVDAVPSTVKHLGIQSSVLGAELVEAIVGSPRIEQLHTLDLSGGTLNDDVARVLVERKMSLRHLAAIRLDRNSLSPRGVTQLTTELPNASIGDQIAPAPDFFFRYVATVE